MAAPTSRAPMSGRAWLAALPDELGPQRRVIAALAGRCETWPLARSLLVGCSLGRGAADAMSDIDAGLGVSAGHGADGAGVVDDVAAMVIAMLPELGEVVDVLVQQKETGGHRVRRIFAQFADGTQLDLAVVPEAQIQARLRTGGAPDFVLVYQAPAAPGSPAADPPAADSSPAGRQDDGRPGRQPPAAYAVTGEQIREWAFLGWCALIDADKYLRRGSRWEAHNQLHEARHQIWALWAAAHGAMYPWHGLSQVLDHDPRNLPPGIESTVAGLDAADLRRAARASAGILDAVSASAARRQRASLPTAMAAYVTRVLSAASR